MHISLIDAWTCKGSEQCVLPVMDWCSVLLPSDGCDWPQQPALKRKNEQTGWWTDRKLHTPVCSLAGPSDFWEWRWFKKKKRKKVANKALLPLGIDLQASPPQRFIIQVFHNVGELHCNLRRNQRRNMQSLVQSSVECSHLQPQFRLMGLNVKMWPYQNDNENNSHGRLIVEGWICTNRQLANNNNNNKKNYMTVKCLEREPKFTHGCILQVNVMFHVMWGSWSTCVCVCLEVAMEKTHEQQLPCPLRFVDFFHLVCQLPVEFQNWPGEMLTRRTATRAGSSAGMSSELLQPRLWQNILITFFFMPVFHYFWFISLFSLPPPPPL